MNKPIFFVDLDDVLADFRGQVELMTLSAPGSLNQPGQGHLAQELEWSLDRFDHEIRRWSLNDHFWLNLPLLPWAKDLMKLFDFKDNAYILTAPWPNDWMCYHDKVRWCFTYLGIMGDHVIPCSHKHLLAGPNRWLIDDSSDNCANWVNAGGRIVKFPAPYQGEHAITLIRNNPVNHVVREIRDWIPDFNFNTRD